MLRRSPAEIVLHQHRHHIVVLSELVYYLPLLLDREGEDVTEPNVCSTRRCRAFERLHDPTDPSTERTAPLCSAHVQLDDVPRALDPVEDEGEFRRRCADGDDEFTGAGLRLSTTTI